MAGLLRLTLLLGLAAVRLIQKISMSAAVRVAAMLAPTWPSRDLADAVGVS
jgi:hypothetical protein